MTPAPVQLRERVSAPLRVEDLRAQFPLLSRTMRGKPLVYLDHASTTQKPQRVIDAEKRFYETMNANIHRGVYELSEQATESYVAAHEAVARFIGAAGPEEIIFTRNATEGINLLAWTWGTGQLTRGDHLLLTAMEHHSNIVPWQRVASSRGASLVFVELMPDGRLDLDDLERKLKARPKFLSVTHMSNVLGVVNPLQDIIALARAAGVSVIVDAAQSVPRIPVDVAALGADFVVFSSHKMYGPTGIGVVVGKKDLLETMEPFLVGGDMVKTVTREGATWNDLPWKFEAGTPNVAGGIALGEAVHFLSEVGMERVWEHEQDLVAYTLPRLQNIPGLRLLGPAEAPERGGVFSFTIEGIHSHDLASFLNEEGIAIRGGHHCAQPLLQSLGLTECARLSVGITTSCEEIDTALFALRRSIAVLI